MEQQHSNTSSQQQPKPGSKYKNRIVKRLFVACGIISGSFVLILALILGIVALILTPARLTPLVNEYSNKYLNAQVNFDTVSLSVLEHFPYVSVKLSGGEIISHAFTDLPDSLRNQIPSAADTLLRFDEFSVSLNLPQLLTSRISIQGINLTRPEVYAYVSPNGKTNWEIYTPDTAPDDTTQSDNPDFSLNIQRLNIRNQGHLVYDSRPDSLFAQVNLEHLVLKSAFGHDYNIDLTTTNSVRIDTLQLCDQLPFKISGGFAFNPKKQEHITLDALTFDIGDNPIVLNGDLFVAQDSISSTMQCSIHSLVLAKLLVLAPPQLLPQLQALDTDLTFDLNATIQGSYHFSNGQLPHIAVDIKTDGGHLYYKETKARIESVVLDASLLYNPRCPDSTGIDLRRFEIEGAGMKFRGSGTIWSLLNDPSVRINTEGSICLDTLTALFPSKNGIVVRGTLGINTEAAFRMSHLSIANIGKTRVNGSMTLDSLLIDIPQDTLFVMVDGGGIDFGSERNLQDSLIGKNTETLRMKVHADTVNINMKSQWTLVASSVAASAHSAASTFSGDTTVIHPLNGGVTARSFTLTSFDSTWMKLNGMQSYFSILPSAEDAAVPLLNLSFDANTLQAKSTVNRYELSQSHIDLHVTLAKRETDSTRRNLLLDSLQRIYPTVPRDSLFAKLRTDRSSGRKDDFASADLDLTLDKSIAALLRNWDAKGTVRAASGRVTTPYFPLANTLQHVDVEFNTDAIKLKNTQIQSGSSSLELTGVVSNLRQVVFGRGNLNVQMDIESDTLNFNELVHAATIGSQYEQTSETYRQSIAEADNSEKLQQVIDQQSGVSDTTNQSPLLIIPANIEVDVSLCAHYGIYGTLHLNTLDGEFIVRDRCLQVKDLQAITDAGAMSLSALYATRSKTDIITGFDLDMKQIQVNKLISLVPAADTLLPMLRSFEGVVDCQLAATAAVDTMMNIDLATLNAACSIHGENMVLLDGETFTEIAKMLRFKNRQRNVIDRVSVNLLVHDQQIELFPFVIDMDRYKAAVSGIHKLDMSFDYHISVLQSPIPFRLGVNIFGTIDKFKFRIGKARYRSENIPSYIGLIDTTRVNLRRTIVDIFHKGIEAASLSDMKITPTTDSIAIQAADEPLSKADSLALRQEGILPELDSLAADSVHLILPTDTLQQSTPSPAESLPVTPPKRKRKAKKARAPLSWQIILRDQSVSWTRYRLSYLHENMQHDTII